MAESPVRKTDRLRRRRVSLPGARYFVTACVQDRVPVLMEKTHCSRLRSAFDELSEAADWRLLAGVVMPDHVHVLFKLGERLPLDRLLAKMKTRGRDARSSWRWQANVFEHRLRADEDAEDYAFYIFMNPYRAKLVAFSARWPGWLDGAMGCWRFEAALNANGTPPIEWFGRVDELAGQIQIGE